MLSPKDNVEVPVPTKNNVTLIRWALNMKVNVSRKKGSKKIFVRSCILSMIISVIILVVGVIFEVKALQVQVNRMNIDVLRLRSKCEKLNGKINRLSLHVTTRYNPDNLSIDPPESFSGEFSNLSEIHGNDRDLDTISLTSPFDRAIPSVLNVRSVDRQNDTIEKTADVILDSVTTDSLLRSNSSKSIIFDRNYLLNARVLLTFETRNRTVTKDERSDVEERREVLNSWRKPRAERLRRSQGRGKKREQKNRRKSKRGRGRGRFGPLISTFIGAVPEQHVTNTVYIGPWMNITNESQYSFDKFHLVEDKMSIEVTTNGLYMISVQIFYFGESTNYSYWVVSNSEGSSTTRKLTKCATVSSRVAPEVSCFTSIVTYLQKGDRLHIQQQEKNRYVNMREGHSFIQIMLLTGNAPRRHSS